ncbi:phage tail length tape measure family protein [Propionivibrio dicarboxylicus]|uniref:Phage tail tape measure protein, lambda family n=1 Tax=Propionivibrio dicarboxylicus TaxID=83767 RepID=A0A1G8LFP7_9RHOO|nr:phage tail length tape measure family protein [Propionivibrio dicarboxylicus]SDI54010.1 phage tail tape measure protein, lambda family [Propionivibrio dicarboxylicus]
MAKLKLLVEVDTQDGEEALKKISDAYHNLGSSSDQLNGKTEELSKAYKAALRGVPAQFTDIVTSLQGGQAPLTVLLQQGGQLKDMFGGVGPAAKALGTYIANLISPLTVGAAALAAFGYAAYSGAQESEKMNQAIILSANNAGTYASEITRITTALSSATGATKGFAADALTQLVATGRVSAANLQLTAAAAINLERAGGQAMSETVKQFAELGKSPVEASIKLNDQYGYLTASIYRQIKAHVENGREAEASALAQKSFADAANRMASQLDQNLGTIERGWKRVKDAIIGAWDALLVPGRESTWQAKLDSVNAQLDLARKGLGTSNRDSLAAKVQLADLEKQQRVYAAIVAAQGEVAAQEANQNKQRSAGVEFERMKEQLLTKEQKLRAEIAKIRSVATEAGVDVNSKEVKDLEAAARDKYTEKKITDYQRLRQTISEKISIAELDARQEEKLTDSQREQAKMNADLATGAIKLTGAEKARIDTLFQEAIAIEKRNQAEDAAKRAGNITRDYQRTADLTVLRIQREAELGLMLGGQKAAAEALYKAEDEGRAIRERILRDLPESAARTLALADAESILATQKQRVAKAAQESYEAQRTFEYGWEKSFKTYEESASNAAKTAEIAFSGSTSAMEGFIKKFATTGKIDITSLGNAAINVLADIQMQTLRTSILSPLVKGAGAWFSDLFSGGAMSAADKTQAKGSMVEYNAKGNVFSSNSLHQYVNTVRDTPTPFLFSGMHAFASGGIFAEAGPEAVMPLKKDSAGRLGVLAQIYGSQTAPNVSFNLINQTGMQVSASAQGSPKFDGEKWVIGVVLEAAQNNPGFRHAMGVR